MPTLAEKKETVQDIKEKLENSSAVYVIKYEGMSVADINELRQRFFDGDVTYHVYKNTLMKRAMDDEGGYDDLYPYLNEMNGFAFVDEDLSKPAKILKKYIDEHKKSEFKAALIDGDFYDENGLGTLAAMKSKEEVIGDIIGLLNAPVTNVVKALQDQGSNIAGAIKEIAEKGDDEES